MVTRPRRASRTRLRPAVRVFLKVTLRVVAALFVLAFVSGTASAQTRDLLLIHLTTGENVVVPITEIDSITFDSNFASVHAAALRSEAAIAFPDPAVGPVRIQYTAQEAGLVDLKISDAAGHVVRRIGGRCQEGTNTLMWDALDDALKPVAAGEYFYSLTVAGESRYGKLVVKGGAR